MTADDLHARADRARRNPVVLRDGKPVVTITCDDADAIADLIEWANDAPHHDGCNARHNDEQLAHDPPLHPYRCKCGRDALAALDGTP